MIDAVYFDGRSTRPQPVQLHIEGGCLHARAADGGTEGADRHWPLAQVEWPERTRHGQRAIHLRSGGSLQVPDAAAFDRWRQQAGITEPLVVRVQQNWRATAAAALALVLVIAIGYGWGVPLAARTVLAAVPESVDRAVGTAALEQIEARWLEGTAVPAARQQALRAAFAAAVEQTYPPAQRPAYSLQFRVASGRIGPNAFALPGGTIVITDELVELLQDQDDTLIGVLGHELGHLRRRHGMHALVKLTLIGAATSVAFGDFSSLLAGAPAIVGQLGYARDAEREADLDAAQLLRASGRSPAAMLVLFDRLGARGGERLDLPIALASHPHDDERKAFFRAAAAARR